MLLRDASSEEVLCLRASKRCMWAKQEGEGAQAPFTTSGTPTHQASKGRMRPTHREGPGGLAGGHLEMGVFLLSPHSSVRLPPSNYSQHQTQLRSPGWEWGTRRQRQAQALPSRGPRPHTGRRD